MQQCHFSPKRLSLLVTGHRLFPRRRLRRQQPKEFRDWPAGASPREVGKRVAERFVSTVKLSKTAATLSGNLHLVWRVDLLRSLSGDSDLSLRLTQLFDEEFTPDLMEFALQKQHVDFSVSGAVPLQIYIASKESRYLASGITFADHQWESPTPDGLSRETRYWIDDMFMITILQVQAYRATGDSKYIDRAATEMTAYLDKLQQPNGLFYHAPDAPFFWGRGNGWVAAGMAELLRSLPAAHPQRARIMAGIPDHDEIAVCLARRGRNVAAATRSSRSLAGEFEHWNVHIRDDHGCEERMARPQDLRPRPRAKDGSRWSLIWTRAGDIRNVCEGTGRKNDLNYYLQRARNTGDLHGQAPILWCASALLR